MHEEAVQVAWNDHHQRARPERIIRSIVLEQILDGQSTEDLEFQTRLVG